MEKELKNPYCRLDHLEFNCGVECPCVNCENFIKNPQLNKRLHLKEQFKEKNCVIESLKEETVKFIDKWKSR